MHPPESIRRLLQRLVVLTTAVTLGLACGIFVFFEWRSSLAGEERAARTTARITADASSAMLGFNSRDEAQRLVDAFRNEPEFRAAALYDSAGKIFAEYQESKAPRLPRDAPPLGLEIGQGRLTLAEAVTDKDRRYGTLYLQVDLQPMYTRLWRYVWTALAIFIGALAAAFLIGHRLQHSISQPVLSLAATASAVSRDRNYEVRAVPVAVAELDQLTTAFNDMLDTIQRQKVALERELAERTRAQQAEAREKQLLATTLSSIGDGVVVTDRNGRVMSLNPEAERLTGWLSADAAGHPLPEIFRIINEDTRAPVENPVDKVLRLGTVVGLANHTLLIRPDGTELPIDDSAAPIRDSSGVLFGVVLVFRDFTAQKQAEVALHESEARERARAAELQVIIDSVPAIIWISRDPDCRVISGNRASHEILRIPPLANLSLSAEPAARPTHFEVLVNGRVLSTDELPVQRAARGEHVLSLEEELRFNDGTSCWLLGHAIPLQNAEGRVYGAVAAFVDISQRKRVEQQLQLAQAELLRINGNLDQAVQERTAQLEEMVTELQHVSYAIAHDMRAPLRAMGTFAELLGEELIALQASATALGYCRRMQVAAGRLDTLIHDALNYSRAVLHEPTVAPVNLSALVRGLIETYPNLQSDRADITIEGPLPEVLGNEALLTQCFSNLLGNAVKFVAENTRPTVWIRAHHFEKGIVRVTIQDNGIGIPEHAQARLFGMFQKLDNRFEGTGIGLAIVRKVVERIGGRVGAQSQVGKGSQFWVDLKTSSNQ